MAEQPMQLHLFGAATRLQWGFTALLAGLLSLLVGLSLALLRRRRSRP